ncbi:MAG: T9SS type A sorting domain-containing protein, partial [Bacteroidota bacterium]
PLRSIKYRVAPSTSWVSSIRTMSWVGLGATLYLMDLSGRHLKQQKLEGTAAKLDLSAYPAGTYVLVLRSPSLQQQWRVVKTD